MACPTPIGFFYLSASSEGACGAINFRSDGKSYDTITTGHRVSSICKTPADKEASNYFNCPAKGGATSAGSNGNGAITTSFTYRVDQYGNIETKRSDTGSRTDNSNSGSSGLGGQGGKLGSPLYCSSGSVNSKVGGATKLKGEYKSVDKCGGKEYIIKSKGSSSGQFSSTGITTQNTCGSQSPIFGGPRDCSMVGFPVPYDDSEPLGGPCSSTNGYPDSENVPACNAIVNGYHSGYTLIEEIASTIGTWLEYIGDFFGGNGCKNKGDYSQTVSNLCTKEKRRDIANQVVDRKLAMYDGNAPQQKCEPNKCPPYLFKGNLACYGWTLQNPHSFGINDTLSSGVGGLIFRAGAYVYGGKLNFFPEEQKVKMFFYYIPCDRDEYGHLQPREALQLCDCGKTTPITSTAPGKELSIKINSKENFVAVDNQEAIISSISNKWKNTDSPADTSTQICWVYDE